MSEDSLTQITLSNTEGNRAAISKTNPSVLLCASSRIQLDLDLGITL